MNSTKAKFCPLIRSILCSATNFKISRNINALVLSDQSEYGKYKQKISALEPICEDMSDVTPYFPESFNIAAYVNNSETLQKLIQLNVNLSKIEKRPEIANKILQLDFERDIKGHIIFINNFVEMDNIGNYITKNPLILIEDIENLEVRINYLKSKQFRNLQIKEIITRNPFWLMFSTERIDKRLGHFQQKFSLYGNEVRELATKQPQLITYSLNHINTNSFVVKEEMGFNDHEIKQLLLKKPKIWMLSQRALLERFNYLHNIINIPHSTLLEYPNALLCRNFKVKQRHLFLQCLGRAQYDAKKENFVPLKALVEETDSEFCVKYAKCNVSDFNTFLKTL